MGRLLPRGYSRESFAGKAPNRLDKARLGELKRFVELGRKELRFPGVALGVVQGGKVVFEGGFGQQVVGFGFFNDQRVGGVRGAHSVAVVLRIFQGLLGVHKSQ